MKEGERTTYMKGETIRDTITCFIPDTVRLSGEVRYKYRYKTDTVYRDVPIVDRYRKNSAAFTTIRYPSSPTGTPLSIIFSH